MVDTYVPGFSPSMQATGTQAPTDWMALAAQLPATIKVYDRSLGYIDIPNPEIDVYRMAALQDQWMAQPFSPVLNTRYDPNAYGEAGKYLSGLDEYAKSLGVTGYNTLNYYPGVDKILPSTNAQLNILPEYSIIKEQAPAIPGVALPPTLYNAEEYNQRLQPALSAKTPYEQMVEYRLGVPINYGLTGKDNNPYQTFGVRYNTPVALLDLDGKVLFSGTGFDAAKQAADQAYQLSRGGKTYTLATADPTTGTWKQVVTDNPNKSAVVDFAKFALPAIGAAALAPVGALAAAGGAAGGSALGGVLAGDSLNSIIKNAAVAGATTYAGGQLLGGLGGGGSSVPTSATGGAAGSATGSTAGNLAGSAAGTVAGEAAPIIVNGIRQTVTPTIGGLLSGGVGGALSGLGTQTTMPQPSTQQPKPPTDEVPGTTVVGRPGASVPGTTGGALVGASPNIPTKPGVTYDPIANEITVANKPGASVPGAAGGALIGSIVNAPAPTTPDLSAGLDKIVKETTPDLDGKTSLQEILDYIRAGGLGISLLGDLFGGGGNKPGTMPGGPSGLNPTFSAALPAASLPKATPRTIANMGQQDWYRYGYGPEQSFFTHVPQGAPNTSTAFTGYAKGGSTGTGYESRSSFAVGGPGDGRDDKIRAALSDGEYVFDAETVAMLGNGSSKAGADALDRFRVNIRKHKGRKLAKGEFSDDAKKPEQYLKGRK